MQLQTTPSFTHALKQKDGFLQVLARGSGTPESYTCQSPRLCSVSYRFLLHWSAWGSWHDKGSEGKC